MPGPHAIALLAVTLCAFFLYTRSWLRMEVVSLLLLLALLLLFYFFPFNGAGERITDADVFHAFGHPALIAICSLMILARGLTVTGALEPAVSVLGRIWRRRRPSITSRSPLSRSCGAGMPPAWIDTDTSVRFSGVTRTNAATSRIWTSRAPA